MLGYKFLRQHPIFYRIDKNWIDFYVADFYCARLMLVIELDGKCHEGHKDYDSDRDEKLISKGLKVLRIRNEELSDINTVIGIIEETIKSRIKQISDNV